LPTGLSQGQLLELARAGANARIAELRAEIAGLEALLGGRGPGRRRGRKPKAVAAEAQAAGEATPRKRRKPRWTAAKRKAVSERMRAYWAKRRRAA
jgi:hypothetical protein